ncbi:peptidase associated/transthyretin-like domain-containing protein [Mucilaginibacter pedocola]|uniref:Carboxypeptidase regulatory-like domain-containing protein n=1 Tax=Mucilaginibacter pedocola TaxID=1792845 RepID=A0A1S9PJG5_9SPHI|nr:hypothetical protein [Mucilaginibacter pedocola]OOQ61086.1 hypothetical protein BC343_21815 [Mucilaginibacter pedocola]
MLTKSFKYSFAVAMVSIFVLFANFSRANDRTIELSGLVVDAENLQPLDGAEIFDSKNTLLGETDDKGYYHITLNCTSKGDLDFKFSVRKRGYKTINEHEHWGEANAKGVIYFGLEAGLSGDKEFSVLGDNKNAQEYADVLSSFDKVKVQQQFNADLRAAKEGNEDVFIKLHDKLYIVNNSGWIQLQTETDPVAIDNKQIVPANKLNYVIKRKQIKGMTPVDAVDKKFVVYTK